MSERIEQIKYRKGDLRKLAEDMEKRAAALPANIPDYVHRESWDQAWIDYLEDRRALGFDDPQRNQPSKIFMETPCVI